MNYKIIIAAAISRICVKRRFPTAGRRSSEHLLSGRKRARQQVAQVENAPRSAAAAFAQPGQAAAARRLQTQAKPPAGLNLQVDPIKISRDARPTIRNPRASASDHTCARYAAAAPRQEECAPGCPFLSSGDSTDERFWIFGRNRVNLLRCGDQQDRLGG